MTDPSNAQVVAAEVQLPAPGTYRIDADASALTFATRHMFGLGAVNGSFKIASGEITIAAAATASTASAVVDVDSFTTGNAARDKDVKSAKFLDAPAHPQITFRSTEVVRQGATWLLRGQLTARGNTAPVELVVLSMTADDTALAVRATTRVDRYAHDIIKMKGMAGRYLDLHITARATGV